MKGAILGFFSLCLAVVHPTTIQGNDQLTFTSTESSGVTGEEADGANLIFASFAGLLQQWPNTFAFSGHSIIPGVIPRGTLLYHGTNRGEPPPKGMEWLAFNPEMSYWIHSFSRDPAHLYTYRATRPLRIIYIDGQSASLGTPGFMDSQSVLINGTVDKEFPDMGHFLQAEYARAHQLCNIGSDLGFEGVIRMNTGFEVIWCDFLKGIEIVQVTNITDPFAGPKPKRPDEKEIGGPPFWSRSKWMNAQAATRQYFAPGEVRVKLDASGFVSFYDRLESLSQKRRREGTEAGPRSQHRLYGISPDDARTIQERLARVLARKSAQGWKVNSEEEDWQGIVLTIIETYSHSLAQLAHLLSREDLGVIERAVQVRAQSYAMLMPYVDFSSRDLGDSAASETIERCRSAFTAAISDDPNNTESITVIIRAIEGTLNRLCSNLYHIFSQTLVINLPTTPPPYPSNNTSPALEKEARYKLIEWKKIINDLMQWLGWSDWTHCDPACKPNEICMIPMWPSFRGNFSSLPKMHTYPTCRDSLSLDE